jgi:hypothetical protein
MRLARLVVVLCVGLPSARAAAERGVEAADPVPQATRRDVTPHSLVEAAVIPKRSSLGQRVLKNMSLLGDELGLHVSALTGDLVRLQFDFTRKQGHFGLGGGRGDALLFRVDGDVVVRGAVARITSRVDLGLGGQRLSLDLPDVDFVTQTVAGERAYELRLPLFEGRF